MNHLFLHEVYSCIQHGGNIQCVWVFQMPSLTFILSCNQDIQKRHSPVGFYHSKRESTAGFYFNHELNNRCCEAFWKTVLDTTKYKLTMRLRHEDGNFLILSHGSEWLQNFFSHINSHRLATNFIKKFHGQQYSALHGHPSTQKVCPQRFQ